MRQPELVERSSDPVREGGKDEAEAEIRTTCLGISMYARCLMRVRGRLDAFGRQRQASACAFELVLAIRRCVLERCIAVFLEKLVVIHSERRCAGSEVTGTQPGRG